MNPLHTCRLYGILDLGYVSPAAAPAMLREMLRGGVDIVQLRAKGIAPETLAPLARALAPLAAEAGTPFVLNDHPALAGELALPGTHIGQEDGPLAQARALVGPGAFIGRSTHSLAQAEAAQAEGADYIGFGPLFATPTKPDYTPIGVDDIRAVHEGVRIPIFCIGGIKRENLDAVLAAGARRVVIVSGILQARDVAAYCRDLKARLEENPLP